LAMAPYSECLTIITDSQALVNPFFAIFEIFLCDKMHGEGKGEGVVDIARALCYTGGGRAVKKWQEKLSTKLKLHCGYFFCTWHMRVYLQVV